MPRTPRRRGGTDEHSPRGCTRARRCRRDRAAPGPARSRHGHLPARPLRRSRLRTLCFLRVLPTARAQAGGGDGDAAATVAGACLRVTGGSVALGSSAPAPPAAWSTPLTLFRRGATRIRARPFPFCGLSPTSAPCECE